MKKALALILALIMLCSSATMIAFAADEVAINIEEMPGYNKTYIGAPIETAPVQNGTIDDDEYTLVRKVKHLPSNKYKMATPTNDFTECFAYDSEFIYYAVSYPGVFYITKQFFFVRLTQDYIINQTPEGQTHKWMVDSQYGLRLVTSSDSSYTQSRPSGKSYPTSEEYVCARGRSEANGKYAPITYELKISRSYLATQMGLGDASDVTKLIYSFYMDDCAFDGTSDANSRWGYISCDHMLTDEQDEWLTSKGVTTSLDNTDVSGASLSRLCNMVVLGEDPNIIDMKEIYDSNGYASTYVGKALSSGDTKPVQDGVINAGEYQKERVVSKDGSSSLRWGVAAPLMREYKEYVSHDDEWIYIGVDFISGNNTGAIFNYYLPLVNSFKYSYNGGSDANTAFTQNGRGINQGMRYSNTNSGFDADGAYKSGKGSTSADAGTAATIGTDLFVANRSVAAESGIHAKATAHEVYEFKISKAWYATQAGLNGASEVVAFGCYASISHFNVTVNSYTNVGHVISDADRAAFKAANGKEYTGDSKASSQDYDGILPHFFILDEQNTDWEAFADKQNLTVKVKPVTEVPVLDGVIGDNEYPTTRTTNVADIFQGNGGGELQGTTVTEYYGHDAEYIYYAVEFEQATDRRYCWPQFKADNTFDIFNSSFNARSRYQACYNWQEGVGDINFSNDIDTTGGATWAAPVDETDMFFVADKDRETNIKVYEFKISKAYIAECAGVELDDVKVVPYYTYFHASCAIGTTVTSDLKTAVAFAGGELPSTVCYNFMSLEGDYEDLVKVEDRLAITTMKEASIRLSSNNPGLRFKSDVSTSDLKALMMKYDYIKVGTLIAPEDFDLTFEGILENNEMKEGTNYINVVAKVDTPFGHDKSIHRYAGSITNLHENNIARSFEAVGYIAYSADGVNWTYVYSDVTAVRSAAEVAHNAIESGDYDNDAAALAILNEYAAKFAN